MDTQRMEMTTFEKILYTSCISSLSFLVLSCSDGVWFPDNSGGLFIRPSYSSDKFDKSQYDNSINKSGRIYLP